MKAGGSIRRRRMVPVIHAVDGGQGAWRWGRGRWAGDSRERVFTSLSAVQKPGIALVLRVLLYLSLPSPFTPRRAFSSSTLCAIASMDPITRDNVFSRGPSTPPPSSLQFQMVPHIPGPSSEPHVSPAPSHREVSAPNTAQSHLDSLLHNLNTPTLSHVSPQPSIASATIYQGPHEQPHSGPATPASGNAGSISSNVSGPNNQTAERQNALLSLLGAVSSPSSNPQPIPPMGPVQPTQIPTPPGSAPRTGLTTSESQGKLLLEQLMSG